MGGGITQMYHAKLEGSISPLPIHMLRRSREGERDLQLQHCQLSTFVLFLSGKKKKKKRTKSPFCFVSFFLFANLLFCPELVLLEIPCS